jgi:hypothetical protein
MGEGFVNKNLSLALSILFNLVMLFMLRQTIMIGLMNSPLLCDMGLVDKEISKEITKDYIYTLELPRIGAAELGNVSVNLNKTFRAMVPGNSTAFGSLEINGVSCGNITINKGLVDTAVNHGYFPKDTYWQGK